MFAAVKRGVFILVMTATACSGKVTITEAEIKPDIFYAGINVRPFTGKCVIVFSDTGLVKEEFTYTRGMLHGKATAWYKSGQMRRRGAYSRGQISGHWEFWDVDGNKTMDATYRDDALNGSYVSHYKNGMIREKGQFADNRRTGKWLYYNEAGQLLPGSR